MSCFVRADDRPWKAQCATLMTRLLRYDRLYRGMPDCDTCDSYTTVIAAERRTRIKLDREHIGSLDTSSPPLHTRTYMHTYAFAHVYRCDRKRRIIIRVAICRDHPSSCRASAHSRSKTRDDDDAESQRVLIARTATESHTLLHKSERILQIMLYAIILARFLPRIIATYLYANYRIVGKKIAVEIREGRKENERDRETERELKDVK